MKKLNLITMIAMMVISVATAKADNVPVDYVAHVDSANLFMDAYIMMRPNLSLQVNESFKLVPEVCPESARATLTWYSNNSVVASVSQSGVITAHSVGTTVVSVRSVNGKKASCTVTVTSSTPDPNDLAWAGTYSVMSSVDRGHVTNYDYPNEFSLTIYEHDGALFVNGIAGIVLDNTIYEGLKVNVIDEQHAEIDLSYSYELGYYSWIGCFLNCMYMISPQPTFQPEELEESKIAMTRNSDGTLEIDDFYIFAFGLATNYEVVLDAAYHNTNCKNESSSVPSITADVEQTGKLEVFNTNGMLVYSGNEESMPQLAPGFYVFNRDGSTQKRLIR